MPTDEREDTIREQPAMPTDERALSQNALATTLSAQEKNAPTTAQEHSPIGTNRHWDKQRCCAPFTAHVQNRQAI